jgi:uncharacterized protein YyaL (SSP411 family)
MSNWGMLLLELVRGNSEVAIVGDVFSDFGKAMNKEFLPFSIVMGTSSQSNLPLLQDKSALNEKTALYVCFNRTCQQPVTTVNEALKQIHPALDR